MQYPLCVTRCSSHRKSSPASAQAMKSVYLFPSNVQEALHMNFLLLNWHSAGVHHPVGRSWFLDSLEAWEAKNTEALFRTYFLLHFRLKKSRPDHLLFR